MATFAEMLVFTTIAGVCIPVGSFLARIEGFRPHWLERELRHSVIAFGGGVLVSAVALVLVPEGDALMPSAFASCAIFLAGGFVFFLIERRMGLSRRETPQVSAMLLDYVPESLALGGMFATGAASAPMLALLIGLQNLPEGFNSYRELNEVTNRRPMFTLLLIAAMVPLGPLCGTLGMLFLSDHDIVLGGIMLFAAGGILYLIFQDIAPQSRLERHWGPATGAVIGFAIGLLGQQLVGHG